jgi:hypothetical protein
MIENHDVPETSSDEVAVAEWPFAEGSVWSIQFAQTRPGMTKEYLRNLSANWTPLMDEAKREGLILNYRVLVSPHTNPSDWDVMLMVEVKNMAALDGYHERMVTVARRVRPRLGKSNCAQFRDLLGMKLVREVILK